MGAAAILRRLSGGRNTAPRWPLSATLRVFIKFAMSDLRAPSSEVESPVGAAAAAPGADGAASPIAAPAVAASLATFAVVYFIVFGAGIWYLFHLFRQVPHFRQEGPPSEQPIRTAGSPPGVAPQPAE